MIRRIALFTAAIVTAVIGAAAPTGLKAQGDGVTSPEEILRNIDLMFRTAAGSDLRNLESLRLICAGGSANEDLNGDRDPNAHRISYIESAGVCLIGMTTPQDQFSIDYFSELVPLEVRLALRDTMPEEQVDQTIFTIILRMATNLPNGEDWYIETDNSVTGQKDRVYFPMSAGLFTGYIETLSDPSMATAQARAYANNELTLQENAVRCFSDLDELTPTYDDPGTPEGEVPDRRVCHWSGQAIALLGGNLQIIGQ